MRLMYSCRKVAELLLEAQDEPLGLFQRLQLKVHLSRCSDCTNFGEQIQGIRDLLVAPDLSDLPDDSDVVNLPKQGD
ncbi:MAG: zf-HC2 domain-containing protein [Burkholderiales bacterium]|nr:zf-HC2 domain-containing protein [Burkholderiales bacterium]